MKYDFYEFPGGGIEKGESFNDALIRETKEDAGLIIKPKSIKKFGYVHRNNDHGPIYNKLIIERNTKVLEMAICI